MSNEDDDQKPIRVSRTGKPLGDYAVGYGRPPVGTRFSASNNPGGRRKGSKNIRTLVNEKLAEKMPVKVKGKTRKMSKREFGVSKLVNRFTENPDLKTFQAFVRLESPEDGASGGAGGPGEFAEAPRDAARRKAILDWFLKHGSADRSAETKDGEAAGDLVTETGDGDA